MAWHLPDRHSRCKPNRASMPSVPIYLGLNLFVPLSFATHVSNLSARETTESIVKRVMTLTGTLAHKRHACLPLGLTSIEPPHIRRTSRLRTSTMPQKVGRSSAANIRQCCIVSLYLHCIFESELYLCICIVPLCLHCTQVFTCDVSLCQHYISRGTGFILAPALYLCTCSGSGYLGCICAPRVVSVYLRCIWVPVLYLCTLRCMYAPALHLSAYVVSVHLRCICVPALHRLYLCT